MSPNNENICPLFADLAEQQRKVMANAPKTTLEEARATIKWLKDGGADKKLRTQKEPKSFRP